MARLLRVKNNGPGMNVVSDYAQETAVSSTRYTNPDLDPLSSCVQTGGTHIFI